MSGIPISVSSGLNNTIFGEIQGPLSLLIEQEYARFQNSEFTLWDKIFKEYKLQTHTGTIGEVGAIGMFEDVGENGAYPISDIKDGFLKHLMAEEWKNSFKDAIKQTRENAPRTTRKPRSPFCCVCFSIKCFVPFEKISGKKQAT